MISPCSSLWGLFFTNSKPSTNHQPPAGPSRSSSSARSFRFPSTIVGQMRFTSTRSRSLLWYCYAVGRSVSLFGNKSRVQSKGIVCLTWPTQDWVNLPLCRVDKYSGELISSRNWCIWILAVEYRRTFLRSPHCCEACDWHAVVFLI